MNILSIFIAAFRYSLSVLKIYSTLRIGCVPLFTASIQYLQYTLRML